MTTPGSSPLVEFRDVSYSVPGGPAPIVANVSFVINQGETVVLLGESGCGKTTTLKLINALLLPSSGEVLVRGKSTTVWDPISLRRQTGYVIQDAGLFPHFTVAENVALVPTLQGWDTARITARVDELLSLVGLNPDQFASRIPSELSGGQKQRVGVARALAAEPPLLLLDEPFGALDPITRASLQREFSALAKRLRKTAVFVTHDLREALLLGDRIGLMKSGLLVLFEPPEKFLESTNPYARSYLETLAVTHLLDADQSNA